MNRISILLSMIMLFSLIVYSQNPSKTETQEFIKSKLSYYLYDIFRTDHHITNEKKTIIFDSDCKLMIRTEYDDNSEIKQKHITAEETMHISDISDIINEKGCMLTITFKSKSMKDYSEELDLNTQYMRIIQNSSFSTYTFIFDSTIIDNDTLNRLIRVCL